MTPTTTIPSSTIDLETIGETYHRDGLALLPSFLDRERYLEPLWKQLRVVIDLTRAEIGLAPGNGDSFDSGLPELLRTNRSMGGRIYDAVRKLPAYYAIANAPEIWDLVKHLMETDMPGWCSQGSGIRMDHPDEDQYLAYWHQEYPSQLKSLDMLTLWIPIVPVDDTMGSVLLCPGSHVEGIMPLILHDPLNANRNGSKASEVVGIDKLTEQYPTTSFDTVPGDLLALHGLTLHRSQPNRSKRTRWSIQLRYFNYLDETGRRIGWTGGMLSGVDLRDVHPECVIEAKP